MAVTTKPAERAAPLPEPPAAAMTHREILEAMSGLLLGMFVAILSSTASCSSRAASPSSSWAPSLQASPAR
jgi:hypothetical protein